IYRYQSDGFMSLHESLLIGVVIACTALGPQILPSRILESSLLKATGVMSYSLYLWQGLFLRSTWGAFGPLALGAIFILSWRFIEQPGIQFGRKLLAKRRAADAETLAVSS